MQSWQHNYCTRCYRTEVDEAISVGRLFCIQQQNLFVVRIEDPTIAMTMKTLFEMAWRSAKPFK